MEFKDYYTILGVDRGADQDEIKRAYRKLARKYHPDVSQEADAEQRFKEVGEAYEVLKDPEKRAAYDQLGADWQSGQEFRPPPNWDHEFAFQGGGFTGGDVFSDFFESLFGRRDFHRGPDVAHGRDVQARIEVTLEQLHAGAPIEIGIDAPEVDRDGTVRGRVKRLKVTVPKGLGDGQSFRLKGQGRPGLGGGPPGDLYVEIRLRPHPRFRLDGLDVLSTVAVAPWEAVLGATIEVPTLGGPVKLTVPAGSTTGTRLRLKGRGLPGNPPGHHFVTLTVDVPKTVSDAERELYRQLAQSSAYSPAR